MILSGGVALTVVAVQASAVGTVWILLLMVALVALFHASAHAGRPCESPKLSPRTIEQAMNLAQRTHQALEASGARVVVIARVGQDLSEYGLRYSHLGLAYRDDAAGAWRIVHKLNHCGSDHASVYRQGLAEFFLDDLHEYEAGLVVLRPDVQDTLLPLLASNRRVPAMHTRSYHMVAYPGSQRYQQSNQWSLETLAHAMDPSANVAFDDHPNERRFAGCIDTITVDSVFAFLRSSGLGGGARVVR